MVKCQIFAATSALLAFFATTVLGKDGSLNPDVSKVRRQLTFNGKINGLELYNADKDNKIVDLNNGTMVYVQGIPDMTSPSFNLNAPFSGDVRSVEYFYNSSQYRIEEIAPFAFCANNRTDFFKCRKLGCGGHVVSVVPYSRARARGEAGTPYMVSFTIVCPPPVTPTVPAPVPPVPVPVAPAPTAPERLAVTRLGLINADSDIKILDLANGTVVVMKDIVGMSTPSFNINASYTGAVVSVAYWYNNSRYSIEEAAPFAFCSNYRADFSACRKLGCGNHTVTAVPYPRPFAQGEAGALYNVSFAIACTPAVSPDGPIMAPVASPVVQAPVAPPVIVAPVVQAPSPAIVAPFGTAAPSASPSQVACLSCTPSNACFRTYCKFTGKCVYTSIRTCPVGQSCEPKTGNCLSQNDLRPCVAVIDESDNQVDSYLTKKWTEFRTTYPRRPFCLLQPVNGGYGSPKNRYGLFIPPAFFNDTNAMHYNITREDTTIPVIPRPPLADWFDLCDIDVYAATGVSFVGLYIDTSGSMTANTVKNMTATFIQKLNQSGLAYKTLFNTNEDWILPFLTDLSTL